MGDLSENFSRNEFACKCDCGCGYDSVDHELIIVLEELRAEINDRMAVKDNSLYISILSGHRCPYWNEHVGGVPDSTHIFARAGDIMVPNVKQIQVARLAKMMYPDRYGIGEYQTFTHIDTRSYKARW